MVLNSLYFTTKIIVTRVVYMKYDSTKSDLRDTEWNQRLFFVVLVEQTQHNLTFSSCVNVVQLNMFLFICQIFSPKIRIKC